MTAASAAALAGMPFKCRPDLERRGLVGRPFGSRTGEPTAFAVAKLGHVSFLPEVYLSIYRQLPSRLCLVSPWSRGTGLSGSATAYRSVESTAERECNRSRSALRLLTPPLQRRTQRIPIRTRGVLIVPQARRRREENKRTRHIVRNNTCLVRRGRSL
jgi:hypothetical protein